MLKYIPDSTRCVASVAKINSAVSVHRDTRADIYPALSVYDAALEAGGRVMLEPLPPVLSDGPNRFLFTSVTVVPFYSSSFPCTVLCSGFRFVAYCVTA